MKNAPTEEKKKKKKDWNAFTRESLSKFRRETQKAAVLFTDC